jgi:hypothetical protein
LDTTDNQEPSLEEEEEAEAADIALDTQHPIWSEEWQEATIVEMCRQAKAWIPPGWDSEAVTSKMRALALDSIEEGSTTFGLHQAEVWGGGFTFDPALIKADEDAIRSAGGLTPAVLRRLTALADDPKRGRLTGRKLAKMLSRGNPEYFKVAILARPGGGVSVPTPPGFEPNSSPGSSLPPTTAQSEQVAGALHRMVYEGFRKHELCFICTEESARELVGTFHCSPVQWAPKHNKESGRNCNNCSFCGRGTVMALNGQWLREEARNKYGRIVHPTIAKIVAMIVDFARKAVAEGNGHKKIRLWKMDLQGAYTLMSYVAEDVHLMACTLPGALVAFFLCGTFGWGGTPYAFQVLTRAIDWELNLGPRPVKGNCVMYVDDIMGVSFEEDLKHDIDRVKELVEGLLGVGAIADSKTHSDSDGVLEVIGYEIRLTTQMVGIAPKNVRKAFHAAFDIGDGVGVTRTQVQRAASHASRYKRICPLLAPFTRDLYGALRGHTQAHVSFDLNKRALRAVWVLRILILLSEVGGTRFSRSFESFSNYERPPEWVIEYDACLTGLSVIWFQVQLDGTELAMGCWAASLEEWGLVDSGFMNSLEFLAQNVGILGLLQRGVSKASIKARGDNLTALAWGRERRYRGEKSDHTAIAQVAMLGRMGSDITETQHLPHTKLYDFNWRCDVMCRFLMSWRELRQRDKLDPLGSRLGEEMVEWTIEGEESFLELCRPTRQWDETQGDFESFLAQVYSIKGME